MTRTIENYPDDGNHLEYVTDLPFCIRVGEDGYYYYEDGVEKKYNLGNKTTKTWICHLKKGANRSLKAIFKVKTGKMETLVEYCEKLYLKSLHMEVKRIMDEIQNRSRQALPRPRPAKKERL